VAVEPAISWQAAAQDAALVSAQATGPPPPLGSNCLSDTIFRALLSMPSELINADDVALQEVYFSVLLIFGLGLLALGALFEDSSKIVCFGAITWVGSFITIYMTNTNEVGACEWPLICATLITVGGLLALALVMLCMRFLQPLLDFVMGFTLGALGMLVLFFVIEHASNWEIVLTDDRAAEYTYASVAIIIAIICGVIGIYFMPVIGVLLRCATGGFLLAIGIMGLVEVCTGDPLDAIYFYLLFGGTGGIGALWQLYHLRKLAEKKGEKSEKTRLVGS